MGIAIAYKGKLRDPGLVPQLVEDLAERARAAGWGTRDMATLRAEGRVKCDGLTGITLYPHPRCEALDLHFDDAGNFINHTFYGLLGDQEFAGMILDALSRSAALMQGRIEEPADPLPQPGPAARALFTEGSRHNWVQTQAAGPEVHAAVCELLWHVQQRYAPDLEIRDDSGFFEDRDLEKLAATMGQIDQMIAVTKQSIEAFAAASKGPSSLREMLDHVNADLADRKKLLH